MSACDALWADAARSSRQPIKFADAHSAQMGLLRAVFGRGRATLR